MKVVEIPTAAIPLIAALGPGLAVVAVVLVKRMATSRLAERALRKELASRMTNHVVGFAPDLMPVEETRNVVELPDHVPAVETFALRPPRAVGE